MKASTKETGCAPGCAPYIYIALSANLTFRCAPGYAPYIYIYMWFREGFAPSFAPTDDSGCVFVSVLWSILNKNQ